jgi:hypothetical protein
VNVAYRGNREQPPTDEKERRPFCRPVDAEKWCKIHHTTRDGLEECRTYLDRKKIPIKLAAQEPC